MLQPFGDQGFSVPGSVKLISYLFIQIVHVPSTSATMFLWIQHKINPDFWEGRHGVATLFNFLSNICVFRLDWVFAQQHSSQTIRNNWTNGAVAKKSKNIYETSEDLSYLWWASTFSLLPYFSPFFFKCCSRIVCWICFGCYSVLAVFGYAGSRCELPSCISNFTQLSF